jgi:hypothetical protein
VCPMIRKLLVCAAIVSSLVLGGCCEQSDYKELASPDGRYVVIEREDNCGATDPFGTAISIQSRHPRLGVAWLGSPNRRVFLANVGLRNTRVRWLDNYNVEIVCTDCERYGVAERLDEWRDLRMHFDVGKATKGEY